MCTIPIQRSTAAEHFKTQYDGGDSCTAKVLLPSHILPDSDCWHLEPILRYVCHKKHSRSLGTLARNLCKYRIDIWWSGKIIASTKLSAKVFQVFCVNNYLAGRGLGSSG